MERAELKELFEAHRAKKAQTTRREHLAPYKQQFDALAEQKREAHAEWCNMRASGDDEGKKAAMATMHRIDKQVAALIAELIKQEPSHLSEPWILSMVISWLRRSDCTDFLAMAFIEQKGRPRPTREQTRRSYDDLVLVNDILSIQRDYECSVREACRIVASRYDHDLPRTDIDAESSEELLRKRFYEIKSTGGPGGRLKKKPAQRLPRPYEGRDHTSIRPATYPETPIDLTE